MYHDYRELPPVSPPCAVTIGSFDGFHLGHQLLLDQTAEMASSRGLERALLTFEPHPARALAPKFSPPLLTSYECKDNALRNLGFERILVQKFDRAFSELAPAIFADKVLKKSLNAELVVVGDDFSFGKGGVGRTSDLVELGRDLGFDVEVVRRKAVAGITISSTRIRSFILQGKVRGASLLLGRPYVMSGDVVRGKSRGRTLGFPTANLESRAELIPARGVYICCAWYAGWSGARLAVTNIGVNPTFGAGTQTVETYVLDFEGDLFGQKLVIGFLHRLRAERSFASVDTLVEQIGLDVAESRKWAEVNPISPDLNSFNGIVLDIDTSC